MVISHCAVGRSQAARGPPPTGRPSPPRLLSRVGPSARGRFGASAEDAGGRGRRVSRQSGCLVPSPGPEAGRSRRAESEPAPGPVGFCAPGPGAGAAGWPGAASSCGPHGVPAALTRTPRLSPPRGLPGRGRTGLSEGSSLQRREDRRQEAAGASPRPRLGTSSPSPGPVPFTAAGLVAGSGPGGGVGGGSAARPVPGCPRAGDPAPGLRPLPARAAPSPVLYVTETSEMRTKVPSGIDNRDPVLTSTLCGQ